MQNLCVSVNPTGEKYILETRSWKQGEAIQLEVTETGCFRVHSQVTYEEDEAVTLQYLYDDRNICDIGVSGLEYICLIVMNS